MNIFPEDIAIYTDRYQLTMAEGYVLKNIHNDPVSFDYFFRRNPFKGGYTVFAGLSDVMSLLPKLKFSKEVLDYLKAFYHPDFIKYLETFEFKGTIFSVDEGTVVFPNEPLIRVEGTRAECQMLETVLLNTINFQSLIATKARRIRYAAGDKAYLIEMGLRRAQGLGGIHASKAAIIGGFDATSNVFAGKAFGIPDKGTMAHSWIMGFPDELTAFRAFADIHPSDSTLLIDTISTLGSGIKNAITVAKELSAKGCELFGVRLDSGDLSILSHAVRKKLDDAGLHSVKITASNQLDEYVIQSLRQQNAPIDIYGVGTSLAIAEGSPAHDGVYKLSSCNGIPKMKFSENIAKQTLPGKKRIVRYYESGEIYADQIGTESGEMSIIVIDPKSPNKYYSVSGLSQYPLQKYITPEYSPTVTALAEAVKSRFAKVPNEYKRFDNPAEYRVGVSTELLKLQQSLTPVPEEIMKEIR